MGNEFETETIFRLKRLINQVKGRACFGAKQVERLRAGTCKDSKSKEIRER